MTRFRTGTRSRGISQTQRRKKMWVDLNPAAALGSDLSSGCLLPPPIAAVGESVAVLQFPAQQGFNESTLLRIRGTLDVPKSTPEPGAGSSEIAAFGIGIVSDQAAEALAVPNPATATGYDWDGWMFLRQSTQIAVDVQGTMVDVKSMRKWESGQSIVFVAGAATDSVAGFTVSKFCFSLRGLFLLP